MDLISRQAAIDYIDRAITAWSEDKEIAIDCLRNLPSAEPVRMKGKWNKIHWKAYRCSECERVSEYQSNFCHNCGADMRYSDD